MIGGRQRCGRLHLHAESGRTALPEPRSARLARRRAAFPSTVVAPSLLLDEVEIRGFHGEPRRLPLGSRPAAEIADQSARGALSVA